MLLTELFVKLCRTSSLTGNTDVVGFISITMIGSIINSYWVLTRTIFHLFLTIPTLSFYYVKICLALATKFGTARHLKLNNRILINFYNCTKLALNCFLRYCIFCLVYFLNMYEILLEACILLRIGHPWAFSVLAYFFSPQPKFCGLALSANAYTSISTLG